jgi:hypothetical protein
MEQKTLLYNVIFAQLVKEFSAFYKTQKTSLSSSQDSTTELYSDMA